MIYSNVCIESFGYELPPEVVTSEDLEDRLAPLYASLNLHKGQLEALTGIHERRFWEPDYKMSTGAIKAGRKALAASAVSPEQIGMLVYGGVCRDHLEPATACAVADGLGLGRDAVIFDISNACLGIINGMIQVANAIALGQIKAGLVTGCESSRQIVDLAVNRMIESDDMELFKKNIATLTGGSGAAAVLLTDETLADKGHRLLGGAVKSAPRYHHLCRWEPDTPIPSTGRHVMNTDAIGVLKNGTALGMETFKAFKKRLSLQEDQPDKIICHQVGETHQKTMLESIGIPKEKDFTTYKYLGNIGTVSLPMTAAVAAERGFLSPADLVGFFGIGSGLNCIMLGIKW